MAAPSLRVNTKVVANSRRFRFAEPPAAGQRNMAISFMQIFAIKIV